MFTALIAALLTSQTAPPPGWHLSGSNSAKYIVRTDRKECFSGESSGYLGSRSDNEEVGFGTLMQSFLADNYRGKRVQLSARVKLKDVHGWAGVWMRIDGSNDDVLGFDNMQERPLRGTSTTWTSVAIVLDVPSHAKNIALGILLSGTGETWIDDIQLDVVDKSVPTTGTAILSNSPRNFDFET